MNVREQQHFLILLGYFLLAEQAFERGLKASGYNTGRHCGYDKHHQRGKSIVLATMLWQGWSFTEVAGVSNWALRDFLANNELVLTTGLTGRHPKQRPGDSDPAWFVNLRFQLTPLCNAQRPSIRADGSFSDSHYFLTYDGLLRLIELSSEATISHTSPRGRDYVTPKAAEQARRIHRDYACVRKAFNHQSMLMAVYEN